jgi:hypothetical protein
MAVQTTEVFDVADWLNRANGRAEAPQVAAVPEPARVEAYVPRHRAEVAADTVA